MLESGVVGDIAAIIVETDLERKLEAAAAVCAAGGRLGDAVAAGEPLPAVRPGRPPQWRILDPREVPERPTLRTPDGRYRLIHSVAHIEISAVELALATAALHPDQPAAYHRDWLRVAGEEVEHARRLQRRLERMGGGLGSEPVHLGLWDAAAQTRGLVERLAVVPRIQEARGLDVSARLRRQLAEAGDEESALDLEVIYRDEIGHVAAGSRWFRVACEVERSDPDFRFLEIWRAFRAGRGSRPASLDREGRRAAGFSDRELDGLEGVPDGTA